MTRSVLETILGALIIVGALWFLIFSYHSGHAGSAGDGFDIYADFSGIGGLKAGDAVEISGVKVGSVSAVDLVPESYLARVHMNLKKDLKLPVDTAASISSESLLGGRYLSLSPGNEDKLIAQGGRIQYTQAPQNLEELLGKFIFSVSGDKKDAKTGAASAPNASAAAPSSPAAPQAAQAEPAPPKKDTLSIPVPPPTAAETAPAAGAGAASTGAQTGAPIPAQNMPAPNAADQGPAAHP